MGLSVLTIQWNSSIAELDAKKQYAYKLCQLIIRLEIQANAIGIFILFMLQYR